MEVAGWKMNRRILVLTIALSVTALLVTGYGQKAWPPGQKVIEVTETKGTVDNPLDGALDAFDLTYVMTL